MTTTCLIPLQRQRSAEIFKKSCLNISGGVNSPIRSFKDMEMTPIVVASGFQDEIVDVDGFRYIDFCNSWGAIVHGHAHPTIVSAVQKRTAEGSSFGAITPIEGELAEKILKHMPQIEKLRFVSSGTEATMTAIRLARGYTGRDLIVKFVGNYHGHSDHLLVRAGSGCLSLNSMASSAGVPQESVKNTICIHYNDAEGIRALFGDLSLNKKIAAVILEPIACNMGVVLPKAHFLELLRKETSRVGALLIFDEVITGFRIGLSGAQGHFGIQPDLTCLGKIIGGGFPAAAFGGRAEIMDKLAPQGPVYQAGTLSGNPVAMEAGFAALSLLEVAGFYEELEEKTRLLTDPIEEALRNRNACLNRFGSLFTLFFGVKDVHSLEDAQKQDFSTFKAFYHHLFQRGIYFSPSPFEAHFVSQAHTREHLLYTRDTVLEFLLDL